MELTQSEKSQVSLSFFDLFFNKELLPNDNVGVSPDLSLQVTSLMKFISLGCTCSMLTDFRNFKILSSLSRRFPADLNFLILSITQVRISNYRVVGR